MARRARCGVTALFSLGLLMTASHIAAPCAAGNPLAEVDGEAILAEEVDRALGDQLVKLNEQIYNLKRQQVEAVIAERLLAKEAARRGISLPELLDAEVTAKVGLVTEKAIEEFYQANKSRLKGEEATLRDRIRAHLQSQNLAAQREIFVQRLRSQAKVTVFLQPPPIARVPVAVGLAPFKGPADAPVTIVEFTDFHCPFCKRVLPTVAQLLARYGEKARLVYKDYPIDSLHPQARRAHEAARCAGEQGKFWAYHDVLFASAPIPPEQLKARAQDVGLDLDAFDKCLSGGKYRAAVDSDIAEGKRAGVTGTPTFFVNGRPISGAQPLEAFVRVIDEELTGSRGQ
jgi:protein-disulfide isomerase